MGPRTESQLRLLDEAVAGPAVERDNQVRRRMAQENGQVDLTASSREWLVTMNLAVDRYRNVEERLAAARWPASPRARAPGRGGRPPRAC